MQVNASHSGSRLWLRACLNIFAIPAALGAPLLRRLSTCFSQAMNEKQARCSAPGFFGDSISSPSGSVFHLGMLSLASCKCELVAPIPQFETTKSPQRGRRRRCGGSVCSCRALHRRARDAAATHTHQAHASHPAKASEGMNVVR